jgi:hypothetical protein
MGICKASPRGPLIAPWRDPSAAMERRLTTAMQRLTTASRGCPAGTPSHPRRIDVCNWIVENRRQFHFSQKPSRIPAMSFCCLIANRFPIRRSIESLMIALAPLTLALVADGADSPARPNIVFILADDK